MKRFPLKYRGHHFQGGDVHTPLVAYRREVYAGETSENSTTVFFETALKSQVRNPAVVSAYMFYCPHRLVWDQWEDFVADPDSGLSIPTTTGVWPTVHERSAQAKKVFFRRAYKLAYNEFFGDEDIGQANLAWFDDITADSMVSDRSVRSVSQLLQNVILDTENPVDNFNGSVSGAVATIELGELDRRLKARRANLSQRFTGEKYSDALRRLGVGVSEALIDRPELLGMKTEVIYPDNTRATAEGTGIEVGQRFAKYAGTMRLDTGRKFFPEHGYVFTIFVVRLALFNDKTVDAPDATVLSRNAYMLDPHQQNWGEYPREIFGTAGDPDVIMVHGFQSLYGMVTASGPAGFVYADQGIVSDGIGDVRLLIYPRPQDFAFSFSPTLILSATNEAKGVSPLMPRPVF